MSNPDPIVALVEVDDDMEEEEALGEELEEPAHVDQDELASHDHDRELQEAQQGQQVQELDVNDLWNEIFSRVNIRMLLTGEERQRALAIKAAIEACDDLEPLSDMMYAQFAFVDHDDVSAAVDRARHLQTYREEYGVTDQWEQGAAISKAFLKQHPGHMLTVTYNPTDGNYVILYDQANFDDAILRDDKCWKIFISYGWYLYHAANPDLHAMRQGVVLISEWEGVDWTRLDPNTVRRVWQELISAYPVCFRELKMFHTGVAANLMAGLMKSFLPARIHSKFNLGCQFEGRLSSFYRIPTEEEADKRVQAELECLLKARYENECTFRL